MTTFSKIYTPLAEPGDILWCYFPQVPGHPGPKKRPALVMKVAEEEHVVMVVYGTSQKVDRIYPSEFLMRVNEPGFSVSNLAYDTKFDMNTLVKLPYNDDWFEIAPMKGGVIPISPVLGTLHPTYLPALKKAYANSIKAA